MRRTIVLFAAVGVLGITAMAHSQKAANPQDEQRLRKMEAAAGQFEQQNDSSKMDLLADDWVFAGNGKAISKKQFAQNVKDNFAAHGNGPSPYTIEKKDMQVYLFGDTAVVTYIKEYRQTPDTTKAFDEDITDVFTRGPKGWLWQFSKSSPVATKLGGN
jgi:ketosteroid isomerase-like protein